MNKKLTKQLLLISYKNGVLDNEIIAQIAEKLDRAQLKQYINVLKRAEKLHNVYIETPFAQNEKIVNNFKAIFPNKQLLIIKNTSLIVGTKVTYNDDVFEVSLKNNLENIITAVSEDYD